jgi:hypothetical protein
VTIDAGQGFLSGGYRWATLSSPLVIGPGYYVLLASYPGGGTSGDGYALGATINSPFVFEQAVDSVNFDSPSFNPVPMSYNGFFGPNLEVVPEPCTMLLVGASLVGLAAYRKKFNNR